MNIFLRNTISKVYKSVSEPVSATRDALAERLQSVRETASLLYNRMTQNMGYGQERLKDIVERRSRGATARTSSSQRTTTGSWWAIWYGCKNKIGVRRETRERIQGDWKFKHIYHKDDQGQHHTTHWDGDKGNLLI